MNFFIWTGLYTGLLWHQFQLNIILKFCLIIQWLNLIFLFFLEKKNKFSSFYNAIAVCIRALLYWIWINHFLFLPEIVKMIEFFLSNNHVTNFEWNLVSCYGTPTFSATCKKKLQFKTYFLVQWNSIYACFYVGYSIEYSLVFARIFCKT